MNVKEIIIRHLEDNNFEGLLNRDGGCGCIKDDLAPCDNMNNDCEPGYKKECSKCNVKDCDLNQDGAEWCSTC